jgi:hypothetical protein
MYGPGRSKGNPNSVALRAEQSTAPDCLQRPLLRRSRFRQQVSASVRCLFLNTHWLAFAL